MICNGLGGSLVCLFLPSFWSCSLVPRFWKGIPPTPLLLIARPSRLLRRSGGWLVGRRGAVGILFLPLVGRLVPLSPAGVLLCFFFVLFVVNLFVFDSLRVLLARVVCVFVCFSFFLVACCKTLVVDPGVSGTVVGFPVHPWSCVLLVLRLAWSVCSFISGVAACCFLVSFFLCWRRSVELYVCCVGGAWEVLFSFACLLMP